MKEKNYNENEARKLREKAESLLEKSKEKLTDSLNLNSHEDIMELIHELSVHQIELRLQNEDLRRTQIEIEESKKKYLELYDFAPVGYLTLSEEGTIIEANLTFSKMLDISKNKIINKKITDFIYFEDQDIYYLYLKEKLKTKNHVTCEIRFQRNDKTTFWVQIECEPKYDDVSLLNAVIIDIREMKRLHSQNDMLELQTRKQQRMESIGTLASGVAHEINNPVNGILNYGQIILDSDTADKDLKEYGKEIVHEAQRVAVIVKNLLEFSRHTSKQSEFTSMGDIIAQTLSLVNTIIKRDQIKLNIILDKDLPLIKCNSQHIQQVIMNLICNSQDALNEKYPGFDENKIINVKCTHFDIGKAKWLKLTVEDFGCGIKESIKDKILDPFFTTKRMDKGTGLGLSISFGIIKEHKGEMTIESKENEYTKFIVTLPCGNE